MLHQVAGEGFIIGTGCLLVRKADQLAVMIIYEYMY
jgi:hypothetical protein